jgi:tetratricopeptide (TPR) repeat protein
VQAKFDQKSADDLMSEAFEALDLGKPEAALKIAKKLGRMRYSGCFEIQALAYADLGEPSKAISVLREGTDKCPGVWSLWQLLGNKLSDAGRFEEAFEAYEKSLRTDNRSLESLSVNYAIALLRSGQAIEARERIRPILEASRFQKLGGSLRARILAVELEALRKLDKRDSAVAFFEAIGDENFGDDAGAEPSMLWSEYARSLFEIGRYHDAERAAVRSVRFNVRHEGALSYLREIRRKPASSQTNHYQLVVEGDWSNPSDNVDEKSTGFFVSYSVCADSEEEAFRFVTELQPDEAKNLRISEAKLANRVTEPKGVYSASGYIFYPEEDNKDQHI